MNNLGDKLQVLSLLPPAAITADGNGTGVDLQQFDGEVAVILHSAAGTGTTPTLDVKIQESDDDATYTDVANGAFAQVVAASLQKLSLNKDELKRYVRAVKDVGGTTPSFVAGAVLAGVKKYGA